MSNNPPGFNLDDTVVDALVALDMLTEHDIGIIAAAVTEAIHASQVGWMAPNGALLTYYPGEAGHHKDRRVYVLDSSEGEMQS